MFIDGEPKLNARENREILSAFFTHCPERFTIEGHVVILQYSRHNNCDVNIAKKSQVTVMGKVLQMLMNWSSLFEMNWSVL